MKKVFFLYLLTFLTCYGFASENTHFQENNYLLQLQESRDTSVVMQRDNKYYLNPERVSISKDGAIFLNSDLYGLLPLSHLMSDNEGLHTLGFVVYICNKCGTNYSSQPSSCTKVINRKTDEKCGNTSFTVTGTMPD